MMKHAKRLSNECLTRCAQKTRRYRDGATTSHGDFGIGFIRSSKESSQRLQPVLKLGRNLKHCLRAHILIDPLIVCAMVEGRISLLTRQLKIAVDMCRKRNLVFVHSPSHPIDCSRPLQFGHGMAYRSLQRINSSFALCYVQIYSSSSSFWM